MMRSIFIIVSCLSMNFLLTAKHTFTYEELLAIDPDRVAVVKTKEFPNTFISYVKIDGARYIVKQKKSIKSPTLSPILDALAAWIAHPLGIAHTVEIIPAHKDFPGKTNTTRIALLLTIVPGATVRSQLKSKYNALSLKQKKGKDVSGTDKWITEQIVDQMTWHDQLPIIVAFDLFISNTGRHNSNLFYDPSQDSFYLIDMDHCYRLNLPSRAIAQFNTMMLRQKIFTQKEVKALKIMKQTLQLLCSKYSAQEIVDKLYFFFRQGCMQDDYCLKYVKKKIKKRKRNIQMSYQSATQLIQLLDDIIGTFERKSSFYNNQIDSFLAKEA